MTRLIPRLVATALAITVLLALQQAPSSRASGFNTGMLYRYVDVADGGAGHG